MMRSHARLPAFGAILAAFLATCTWVPAWVVAAKPPPRSGRCSANACSQRPFSTATTGRWAAIDFDVAGLLGAPAALAALALHKGASARRAFGAIRGRGRLPGVWQTPLRQSPMNIVAPPMASQESQQRAPFAGMAVMGVGFLLWYTANIAFNIVNKQALGLFPHAWTVSVVQLSTVVACSLLGWASGAVASPFRSMDRSFLWRLLPAAACHAVGNGLTSVAFSWGSVSFAHIVKTSEPVWMALGNLLITGAVLPLLQLLSLIPVMLGVALASAGELAFSWVGFLAALGSTVAFAGRGIFSKRLMSGGKGMSPLNVYALDSMLALVFTLPVAAAVDGPRLLSGSLGLALAGQGQALAGLLAATGLTYYAYNAIAFKLLGKLDVVSHAVGNLGKRISVIGFSVIAFNTPLTLRAVVGSAIAILGSGLYSYVKATAGKEQRR